MQFDSTKAFLIRCFDFDYGIACIITFLVFGIYLCYVMKKSKSQEQGISKKKILCGLVLSVYLTLLICFTLLNRVVEEDYHMELLPFWSYSKLFMEWDKTLAREMVCNVILFIPWGILCAETLSSMQKFCRNVGSALCFSVLIEVIQLVFKCGWFEFDDMYHNTLGAVIGYGVWKVCEYYTKNNKKQNTSKF